jgi:predicted alpha/beta-hydrolase family hydrolase
LKVYRAAEPGAGAALILGHGAGAGQHSTFMTSFARAFSSLGVDTITFDFPYMAARRRVPDRGPVLEASFRTVVDRVREELDSARDALFIGGKSMGGRIATQLAANDSELGVRGLVLLGYPLHPPGRPDERRDKHLAAIHVPMLFVQGERDAFGTAKELESVVSRLAAARLHVVPKADHSLKVPRATTDAQAAVYAGVQRTIAVWIRDLLS